MDSGQNKDTVESDKEWEKREARCNLEITKFERCIRDSDDRELFLHHALRRLNAFAKELKKEADELKKEADELTKSTKSE
jgi:hypothetical protein